MTTPLRDFFVAVCATNKKTHHRLNEIEKQLNDLSELVENIEKYLLRP